MSIQKVVYEFLIELARFNFRRSTFPPVGLVGAVMKSNATELPVIADDQSMFFLKQNQMVALCRPMVRGRDIDLASHAEMNAQPIVSGKLEQHPFPARVRADEFLADQSLLKLLNILAAKDAVLFMQGKIDNLPAEPGIPLFTKPFDLGQLGHGSN